MAELIMEETGLNAKISVYSDKVVITRKGLHALTLGKSSDVLMSRLQGIHFREAGFSAGYLKLLLPGDKTDVAGTDMDPYTVMFKKNANEAMKKMKDCIYSHMEKPSVTNSTTVVNQVSSAEELKKFKELLDSGIISQEEFDAKKKQILGL